MSRFAKPIVVLAVFCGAVSGIFSKLITANAMAIGFYRLSFAVPFLFLPIALKGFEPLKNISRKDLIWSVVSGVFLFGHFSSWFAAVKHTTIASGVVLAALHPVVVLIALVFVFKKKISPLAVLGILIAMVGGSIVAGYDYNFSREDMFGNLLAISAAVNMGVYFVIGNRIRARVSATAYVFIVFFTCWICFTGAMFVTETPFTGYPLQDWILFAAATAVCQFGAHGLFNWSMGYVSSLYVSAWGTAEIVFATALAFIVFGEIPTTWQIIGAIVVIAGLLLYNVKSEEKDR